MKLLFDQNLSRKIGNCSTDAILRLIKDSVKRIEEFAEDPMQSFLILRPKSTP
jgi:predicted nuclease of predicted toxin-antitoxin system